MTQHTLITLRLADMHRVHPKQDNSRTCAKCGQQVGIYPSEQAMIRKHPNALIVCFQCHDFDELPLAAGPISETEQEMRDSIHRKPDGR